MLRRRISSNLLYSIKTYVCYQQANPLIEGYSRCTVIGANSSIPIILKRHSSDFHTTNPEKISELFTPISFQVENLEDSDGEILAGPIKKSDMVRIISKFYEDKSMKRLAKENGLDEYIFTETSLQFRRYVTNQKSLPTELHIIMSDVIKGSMHYQSLYPFFYQFALRIFPHLTCLDALYRVSDLTSPPSWYPHARQIKRRIIFHAGPTNSGKTYNALKSFLNAESGIYGAPLKLLATEIYSKSNNENTCCNLLTGDENVRFENSKHSSCTIEMVDLARQYDVAIIDEIQMLSDAQRGWAWTRALLGVQAKEVHVCGEPSAVQLVENLASIMGETVEVNTYQRKTPLIVEKEALGSLNNVRDGDCIVCFNKKQLFGVTHHLESLGKEIAVIYGALPPRTKLAQAKKFNDPNHPCKILVATDAIGFGLNLNIGRVIFLTLSKLITNDKGSKVMENISVSQALQIGGRAGRFNTAYDKGFVTCFSSKDYQTLQELMSSTPSEITNAGLSPTAEQMELFANYLSDYSLAKLIDIFTAVCSLNSMHFFICQMDGFKYLAEMTDHIDLDTRSRYMFCCAPISQNSTLAPFIFVKCVKKFANKEVVSAEWILQLLKWPIKEAKTIRELVICEESFDVLDMYLWLSFRFPDTFLDRTRIRQVQEELEIIIQNGVSKLTNLISTQNSSQKIKNDGISKQSAPKKILTSDIISQDLLKEIKKDLHNESKRDSDAV